MIKTLGVPCNLFANNQEMRAKHSLYLEIETIEGRMGYSTLTCNYGRNREGGILFGFHLIKIARVWLYGYVCLNFSIEALSLTEASGTF